MYRFKRYFSLVVFVVFLRSICWTVFAAAADGEAVPQYTTEIAPLLAKYCVGCHNTEDREGGLSVESYSDLQVGLKKGPVILAGHADSSRLIRVLTGQAKPKMPPEDSLPPSQQDILLLRRWIDSGAKGPDGTTPSQPPLLTPQIEITTTNLSPPITALASSPNERYLAVARFAALDVLDLASQKPIYSVAGLPGKIHAVSYTADSKYFAIATGITGLYGEAQIYAADAGNKLQSLFAHRDTLYDVEFSPNGQILATASYDRSIVLWNIETGTQLHTLQGHHGAIFDLEFSPDGKVLASASGDETVKLWHVASGKRLDTLGQPEGEQYCVAFSPDGQYVVAGGADRRIRVWKFVSHNAPQINPLVISRFAHEQPILQLAFTPDSKVLVSTSNDRTIKTWETETFVHSVVLENQPSVVNDLCVSNRGEKIIVGRLNGSWDIYPVTHPTATVATGPTVTQNPLAGVNSTNLTGQESVESEPNDTPHEALTLAVPARIKGVIHQTQDGRGQDIDLFRFSARQGEHWTFEIHAARNESPLDSQLEILTSEGRRIKRVRLQAVRDSYLTFMGQDSNTHNGFRLHHWEEMELNEFLYAGGEVMKLWHYPRGPDSGFILYPGYGKRFTYFDTTALSHALHKPVYIVKPYPPGTQLTPTGLPIFDLYFENDDGSARQTGKDSHLTFVAPGDGEYLAQVTDVRGFESESYCYELVVRQPQPDFEVTAALDDTTIAAGSGREFSVTVNRQDGFSGEVRVDIEGLPPGFYASSPLIIQAGQGRAFGTITALCSAPKPTAETASMTRLTASAMVNGHHISKSLEGLGELKLGEPLPAQIRIVATVPGTTDELTQAQETITGPPPMIELVIAPGETRSAYVYLERTSDFSSEVRFGGHDAARNLPHGVYVDNIGLSGLLVNADSDQREFFITAAKWVPETTRLFHLRGNIGGQHSSWPVRLHVRHPNTKMPIH